jgi:hypothetical protein
MIINSDQTSKPPTKPSTQPDKTGSHRVYEAKKGESLKDFIQQRPGCKLIAVRYPPGMRVVKN